MSKRSNTGLWEYLEASGVLEKGTDEEIKAVKQSYRKEYLLLYKRKQRASKPEFTVNFNSEDGEFARVSQAAKRHKMPITTFLRVAVMAYLEQTFIVPNVLQIAELEQLLSNCLNEVQSIVRTRERYHWEREQKLEAIEKIIIRLEEKVNQLFRNPPVASHDSKNQII